ncbi:MAG: DUF1993 domain-containing protein [Alphaproteobacteria bacterium]|nr:DUF1993 domain-containing protein [Alphaproteobacteria bacterium]
MSLSMYQASVPVFVKFLTALAGVIDKAVAHAQAKKIDPAVLLGMRLYPDMFPLATQIWEAADFAVKGVGGLAGIEIPKLGDPDTTFDAAKQRLAKAVAFLQSLKPAAIDGSEARDVTLTLGGKPRVFKGQDLLLTWSLPNFYFHVTTAYGILRHAGVEIGKRDFLGLPPSA